MKNTYVDMNVIAKKIVGLLLGIGKLDESLAHFLYEYLSHLTPLFIQQLTD